VPWRLYLLNAFIAVLLAVVVIDTLPQSPPALRDALVPTLVRLGLNQGSWTLFAPKPDHVNSRIRAEITYRDGERREWRGPDWSKVSLWEKWVGHRRFEWYDHVILQPSAPAWESWCRDIARAARPDFENADRGAEVQVVYTEAVTPPPTESPWRSIRDPMPFNEGWVLTIEKLQ
jgi:hypothetical protein